jgi:dihydropteroate synthase
MRLFEISKPTDIKQYLKELDVNSGGIEIISQKMDYLYIEIQDLKTPAINILKQDALSVGAEVAVPSGVIICQNEYYNCLLIGTKRQLLKLAKKEKAQPFGLKNVAQELESILNYKSYPIKIMGVLNINSDSFYSGSRFSQLEAVNAIELMVKDGADIIDIGALSSRPGASAISQEEELNRVKELLDTIKEKQLTKKATFSIDSYAPKVVEYALNCGFKIVNDITGAKDSQIIKLAAKFNAKLCIMHMQGNPQNMQNNPQYDSVTNEVDNFFKAQIAKCQELGLSKDNIILDVGIGFGKTLEHNIELIKNHNHFKHFGCELLIGASRKSMIDKIYPSMPESRLPGTLAIHLKAIDRGANIIRCHDVAEHKQAIDVYREI